MGVNLPISNHPSSQPQSYGLFYPSHGGTHTQIHKSQLGIVYSWVYLMNPHDMIYHISDKNEACYSSRTMSFCILEGLPSMQKIGVELANIYENTMVLLGPTWGAFQYQPSLTPNQRFVPITAPFLVDLSTLWAPANATQTFFFPKIDRRVSF